VTIKKDFATLLHHQVKISGATMSQKLAF